MTMTVDFDLSKLGEWDDGMLTAATVYINEKIMKEFLNGNLRGFEVWRVLGNEIVKEMEERLKMGV